jgi:uncharacterized protein (UPF0248 family)
MIDIHQPLTIEKERIAQLHFPSEEVLTSIESIVQRSAELDKASRLGNMDKLKFKIVFEDNEGVKQVETTIWAVTKESVVLKHGLTIPVHRIHEIKI